MSPIYVERDGGYVQMTEQHYLSEAVLQELLASNPELLNGDNEASDRRWLLVKREVPVPDREEAGSGRWSVDHLFLDQDGVPTLVEVKRSTNTQIRREIVGQLIEYGANAAVAWSVESIRGAFYSRERDDGAATAEDELDQFLLGEDIESFWEQVKTNLAAEKLRLVFVADEFPRETVRMVEFLNGQMSPAEVLAVEVRQFVEVDGDRRTLVPRMVGQTEVARVAKTRRGSNLTQDELFESLGRFPSEIAERMQDLYSWMLDEGGRPVHRTKATNVWLGENADKERSNPVSLSFNTKGESGLSVCFVHMLNKRSEAEMLRMADLLDEVPGMQADVALAREKGLNAWCNVNAPEVLSTDEGLEALKAALLAGAQPPLGNE